LKRLIAGKTLWACGFLIVALAAVPGCNKKPPAAPAAAEEAPSAPAAQPTAQITASPTVVSAGDAVQLSWHTTNATNISIDGLGDVPSVGVKTVTPSESTTYHLVARSDAGSADASARVTVNGPPEIKVPSTGENGGMDFKARVQDVFFDYDTYDIRPDAQAVLSKDADYLVAHPEIKIVIGGYCDERGSDEYNLALGQNRAQATKSALVTAGVAADRVRIISYGKEKPFCTESNEECWQLNRRAGFSRDQ
jgi:peptidoglycan-associated lipoprotein